MGAQADTDGPISILFIGNSYTYFNRMTRMLQRLSAAAGTRPIRPDECTAGGRTLSWHWRRSGARGRIRRARPDLVVLQEQSVTPIYDPDRFARYAGLFCGRARAAGAEPLLFLTWARRYAPEMQDRLTEAYMRAARRSGARVAPVGEAWRRALAGRRGLVLHTPDASHPNRAGSYLAACVFHATIHARSPVGLPGRLSAGGRGRRRDVLVSLKKSDAAFLQRAAWGAVKAFAPRER